MNKEKNKKSTKIPKEFKTERLVLKPISTKYSKEIFENFTDEITALMFPSTPKEESETIEYLKGAEKKTQEGENYEVLVFDNKTNEFLGGGGLHKIKTKTPELGIWIKKSAHGQKYGKETIMALKEWANENLDYDYLKYPVAENNIASRKIPESLGGKIVKQYKEKNMSGNILNMVEYHI